MKVRRIAATLLVVVITLALCSIGAVADETPPEEEVITIEIVDNEVIHISLNTPVNENGFESAAHNTELGADFSLEIASQNAPHTFSYSLEIPEGGNIDYVRHLYTGEPLDGSLVIYNAEGDAIAYTGAPKAVDSEGIPLLTNFEIVNDSIILDIPRESTNTVYPIDVEYEVFAVTTAATLFISDYWTSYGLLFRDDKWGFTLSGPKFFLDITIAGVINESWAAVRSAWGGFHIPIGTMSKVYTNNIIAMRELSVH